MVSLYFVAGGEVCPGASIAALQQSVPRPSLSQKTHCLSPGCVQPEGAGAQTQQCWPLKCRWASGGTLSPNKMCSLFCLALVILVSKSFVTILFYFYSLRNSFHQPCVRVEPCFLCRETDIPVRVSVCSPLPCSK